jgi:transposase
MANSRMLAMAAAIALRSDFTGADLRRLARRTQDAKQARRLLSLATIYDGGSRSDAARIGDVGLQIIRDWVLRFNAAGPDGLVDRKAPGPEPRLNEDHRAALAAAIESGPIPAIHSVVRWRLVDLCQWLWEEFRQHRQTNAEPGTAQSGLPQAHRPAAPSRSGGGSDRAF